LQIHVAQPLFAWSELDDGPSLATVREFLAAIPDGKLLAGLRADRGRGRNDFPVHVLWGVVLLTAFLRHPSFEACLGDLRRNPALRAILGIESEAGVPAGWNLSRFLDVLGRDPHRAEMQRIFNGIVQRLGVVVDDLGADLAGDSTALKGRRSRKDGLDPDDPADAEKAAKDADGLPQPNGGHKEYTDAEGSVVRVLKWWGYKLHLLVDAKHEVVVAYDVTAANSPDNEQIPGLLAQAKANLPGGRIETLAYDKAADDQKIHELLDDAGVAPVIENRSMWKEELDRKVPGIGASLPIVYDEAGTVFCYDTVSQPPVRQAMAYIGHEAERRTLKYRCPAAHEGRECPSAKTCNAGRSYGLVVRIDRDLDLRRFPPVPRATKKFERLYKGRTAVERVNARLKLFWGSDDGNVAGTVRFHAHLGAVMVVHAAVAALLASCPRHDGTLSKASIGPVAMALQERLAAEKRAAGKAPPAAGAAAPPGAASSAAPSG